MDHNSTNSQRGSITFQQAQRNNQTAVTHGSSQFNQSQSRRPTAFQKECDDLILKTKSKIPVNMIKIEQNPIGQTTPQYGRGSSMQQSSRQSSRQSSYVEGKIIEKAKLFRNVAPIVRQFVMQYPNSDVVQLNTCEQLAFADGITNFDYFYVMKGAIEMAMKLRITHVENQFETVKPAMVQGRTASQVAGRITKMTDDRLKRTHSNLSLALNPVVTVNDDIIQTPTSFNSSQRLSVQSYLQNQTQPNHLPKPNQKEELIIRLQPQESINPDIFLPHQRIIKFSQLKKMPYLQNQGRALTPLSRMSDGNSFTSSKQSNRFLNTNPVFGYSIQSIQATQKNTQVFRIKSDVFNRYLSKDSIWFNLDEKQLCKMICTEFLINNCSQKTRYGIYGSCVLRELKDKEILLREGQIPINVYVLLQGKIDVYQKKQEAEKGKKFMATTLPGTRIMQQVLQGDVGKLATTLEGNFKTLSTVGEDCVLLNLASPHTYVARGNCTVFAIESQKFGKVLGGLGEQLFERVMNKAREKLNQITQVGVKIYKATELANNMSPIMKWNNKEERKVEQSVDQHYSQATTLARLVITRNEFEKQKQGKIKIGRGVVGQSLRGHINQNDMVALNYVKAGFFLNDKNVQAHIKNIKNKRMGLEPLEPIKNLLRNDCGSRITLDNQLDPMSSLMIKEPYETICFKPPQFNAKALFQENFYNKYYPMHLKMSLQNEQRRQETEQEAKDMQDVMRTTQSYFEKLQASQANIVRRQNTQYNIDHIQESILAREMLSTQNSIFSVITKNEQQYSGVNKVANYTKNSPSFKHRKLESLHSNITTKYSSYRASAGPNTSLYRRTSFNLDDGIVERSLIGSPASLYKVIKR